MPRREKTTVIIEGATGNLPSAVSPSASEPQHSSWARLEHLYRITRLLLKFETREKTLESILAILTNTLPLRTAILIDEEMEEQARVFVWRGQGVSRDKVGVARKHAVDTYAYLAGCRSTEEAQNNLVREQPVDFRRKRQASSEGNFIVIPLVVDPSHIFGALQLEGAQAFNEDDLAFVNAIANQVAVALDRYRARHREMIARAEAETAERRMRFLADASKLLAASFDYRTAWEGMARLAVPDIADYCFIDVLENSSLKRIAVVSQNLPNAAAAKLEGLLTDTVRHAIQTRQPIVSPATADNPVIVREPAATSDPAVRSFACLPLCVNAHCLGTITLVSFQASRLYTSNDVVLFEDLARRAVMSFENAQLYLDTLQAVRSRDDVLNAVSHDLNGPLAVVAGFVDIFLAKRPREQALICDRKQVEAIQRSAKQMRLLIKDLLDTASIDAKHLTVQPEECAVLTLLNEAMELPQTIAANKGLQLRAEIPSDLPSIFVDRHRILQVFANLIGNAIKFTPEGGTVTVHAQRVDDEVQFCVEDTGPGISQEEQAHLFDRFWQARKTARMGTGLGLFIVKGIVEGHGGRTWVESTPGVGSKFFFTLQIREP